MEGKAFIFSAPSGSGKTTIVRHLLDTFPDLSFSISATTRPPRGGEVHGRDYYFLSHEAFDALIREDGFVEYEEVYDGVKYGTLKAEVERIWSEGKHVVFDVDVIGGINLKRILGDRALAVFVKVASPEVLRKRLIARGTEDEAELKKRIGKAEEELQYEKYFDFPLVNDNLRETLSLAEKTVQDFLSK